LFLDQQTSFVALDTIAIHGPPCIIVIKSLFYGNVPADNRTLEPAYPVFAQIVPATEQALPVSDNIFISLCMCFWKGSVYRRGLGGVRARFLKVPHPKMSCLCCHWRIIPIFPFENFWCMQVSVCFHNLVTYAQRLQDLYSACLMF
jgi:hypothetical protein